MTERTCVRRMYFFRRVQPRCRRALFALSCSPARSSRLPPRQPRSLAHPDGQEGREGRPQGWRRRPAPRKQGPPPVRPQAHRQQGAVGRHLRATAGARCGGEGARRKNRARPRPARTGAVLLHSLQARRTRPALAPRAAAAWPFPVPASQRWQQGAHHVLRAPPPQQVLHLRPGAGRPPEDAEAQARRNRVSTQAQPPSSLISRRALRRRTKTLTTEKIYDHAEANAGAGRGSIDNGLQEREGMAVE